MFSGSLREGRLNPPRFIPRLAFKKKTINDISALRRIPGIIDHVWGIERRETLYIIYMFH